MQIDAPNWSQWFSTNLRHQPHHQLHIDRHQAINRKNHRNYQQVQTNNFPSEFIEPNPKCNSSSSSSFQQVFDQCKFVCELDYYVYMHVFNKILLYILHLLWESYCYWDYYIELSIKLSDWISIWKYIRIKPLWLVITFDVYY